MSLTKAAQNWSWKSKLLSPGARYLRTLLNKNTSIRPTEVSPQESENSLPPSYLQSGSVYVHWPYCRQRCTYCNFVKFVPRPNAPWTLQDEIIEDAMVREVQHNLRTSHITCVQSVFFGGGTPSLARPLLVQKILQAIQEVCELEENAEVTLEVNPTPAETRKLEDFKILGVNRVSIGVQSLEEETLRQLGRDHCVREAVECVREAHRLYPGRVSVDVIFGRPYQTLERWRQELKTICGLSDNHVSLYQLTVERGTKLHHQVESGSIAVPCVDQMAEFYETAIQQLGEVGLQRYEVSNFARHASSQSIHNLGYWRASQYIGIGPGAHSRIVPRNGDWGVEAKQQKLSENQNLRKLHSESSSKGCVSNDLGSNNKYKVKLHSEYSNKGCVSNDISSNNKYKVDLESRFPIGNDNKYIDNEVKKDKFTSLVANYSNMQLINIDKNNCKLKMPKKVDLTDVIREARVNAADPVSWLRETRRKGTGVRKVEQQRRIDVAAEHLVSGLRTYEGVTNNRWSVFLPHLSLVDVFGGEMDRFQESGVLHLSAEGLKGTERGLNVLDSALPHLLNILYKKVS